MITSASRQSDGKSRRHRGRSHLRRSIDIAGSRRHADHVWTVMCSRRSRVIIVRRGDRPSTCMAPLWSQAFFVEISDVLDRLATFVEPVPLTGDVNIRLERSTDSNTGWFVDMLTARCLAYIPRILPTDSAGRWISSRRVSTSCHRGSTSSTSVCYCGGRCRWLDRVQSTRRRLVDRGLIWTCCFPCCLTVVATLSPRVLVHTRYGWTCESVW